MIQVCLRSDAGNTDVHIKTFKKAFKAVTGLRTTYQPMRLSKGDNVMARVKVLLTKDVAELGHAGEVYAVAGGYARNYLMPRGLAVLATRGAMKQADEIKAAATRRRARERANAEAQAQMIAGKKLIFAANAGENDRLYGSVTSSDIAEKAERVGWFRGGSPPH
jgi:ribosomal protein L9